MSAKQALGRVWRTWRYAFVTVIVIYIIVFYFAFTYEVHRKEEEELGEEPTPRFEVTISPQVAAGTNNYVVKVTNDQAYTIQELSIEFSGAAAVKREDYSTVNEDTVGAGAEISYSIPVERDASTMNVQLDGQELVTGMTDINMVIKNANGSKTWMAETSGNHETLHLTEQDIGTYGYGTYTCTVRHDGGLRAVPYQLEVRVTYTESVLSKQSPIPLEPGDSALFDFLLRIEQQQLENLRCNVRSTVTVPAGLSLPLEMTFNANWTLIGQKALVPEEHVEEVPWGPVDITGTSSATFYMLTIIAGTIFAFRIRIGKATPRLMRRVHCFISMVTSVLVLDHMSVAVQKDWPWLSPGMLFAESAFGFLLFFTIFSLFDIEIMKRIGRTRFRVIHILLTCTLALFIVLHFGFMGDHLGWIRGTLKF